MSGSESLSSKTSRKPSRSSCAFRSALIVVTPTGAVRHAQLDVGPAAGGAGHQSGRAYGDTDIRGHRV